MLTRILIHQTRSGTYALQMQHSRIRCTVCTKSEQGYPFNLPDRYLFTRSKWTGRIAAPTTRTDRQNRLNHGSRAMQNANRVYHYDLAGYRLPDTRRRFLCFTVWCSRLISTRISYLERSIHVSYDAHLKRNENELFQNCFSNLIIIWHFIPRSMRLENTDAEFSGSTTPDNNSGISLLLRFLPRIASWLLEMLSLPSIKKLLIEKKF